MRVTGPLDACDHALVSLRSRNRPTASLLIQLGHEPWAAPRQWRGDTMLCGHGLRRLGLRQLIWSEQLSLTRVGGALVHQTMGCHHCLMTGYSVAPPKGEGSGATGLPSNDALVEAFTGSSRLCVCSDS